jgi:hypothetical protein
VLLIFYLIATFAVCACIEKLRLFDKRMRTMSTMQELATDVWLDLLFIFVPASCVLQLVCVFIKLQQRVSYEMVSIVGNPFGLLGLCLAGLCELAVVTVLAITLAMSTMLCGVWRADHNIVSCVSIVRLGSHDVHFEYH